MMNCIELMNTYTNERNKNEIISRDLHYEVRKLTDELNEKENYTVEKFEYYEKELHNEQNDFFMFLTIVIAFSTFAIINTYLYFKK